MIGLEAVLLEEHPLQRFGAVDAVLRRQRRAAGDVPEDGVGLGEIRPGATSSSGTWPLGFIARNSGVRVSPLRMSISTRSIGNVELRQREPHLVAIARSLHGIERVHASAPGSCPSLSCDKRIKRGDCKAEL